MPCGLCRNVSEKREAIAADHKANYAKKTMKSEESFWRCHKMPIENQTPESANQGPEYGQTTRGFTRVLRAAEHCLRVFDPDPKTQIARAMLETRKDAHLAEL